MRETATAMPIAEAPAIETTARVVSILGEMRVWSGLPRISSRAWAPTPIASAKASVVQPSSAQSMCGASAAPTATYERCQSVYGGWRRVT